jgi:hypothetical protein
MHPDGWMDGDEKGYKPWHLEPFKKSKEMKRCVYLVFN